MSFISLTFTVFFVVLVILYHIIGHFFKNGVNLQNFILLAANLVFYSFADLRFMPFLLFIILLTYFAGLYSRNKILFCAFIIAAILPLLSVKYCPQILHSHWIFPLGISFFTFQSISYIADVYKKKITAERNILNVALFISFFPVISSGPIQRAGNLIPQFLKKRQFNYNDATDGMKLFAWGMFKKLCIADRIAIYVNYVYGSADSQYGIALLLATVLYAFQIYYDFSGYSDMAIGLARYLGFDAGRNFDHPYLSKSVGEFWRRWHISLSSWLRDYVYIPLGGSRVALPRIYLNLVITFLVSGIWHGSTINFVIWGLLHGFFQCAGRMLKPFWEKHTVPDVIRILVTFCLVTFAWIFFRAENLSEAGLIIRKILQIPSNIIAFPEIKESLGLTDAVRSLFCLYHEACKGFKGMFLLLGQIIILFIIEFTTRNDDGLVKIRNTNFIIRWLLYLILLYNIMLFGQFGESSVFIYNQF
jgi:D-alanyl-lipoteichoic acid acyltransferase DltB (MBOAT superfamily)